ncbi:MAG: DUF58 domain-containing protein [Candidatus Xenobia bacterium]
MSEPLLDADFLRRLERLAVVSKKVQSSLYKGEHQSPRRGRSMEFADYRDYVPGDDFRYIDWNVFGRLDRLFLKLFSEEEELALYCLVDTSASMGFGHPSRLRFAARAAAALCYVALCNYDSASVMQVGAHVETGLPLQRGRHQAPRLFSFLNGLMAAGTTDLGAACIEFSRRQRRRGVVILLSDLLCETDLFSGIKALLGRRHDVFVVQVLDREERDPSLSGDLRLIDAETGAAREVTVTERVRQLYREALARHVSDIEAGCRRYGVGFMQVETDLPVDSLLLDYLRQARLVR